ncbi:related to nuclear matrix protein p84 [Melanopsichium pennsylvanicum]|uniref:Related to nuclear matrix protein p84 n=2 Tax=Melanopsichium pennsylvanicum TaxID=63383 RepID=A0AAJ5C7M6_9BASI|nr:related to nuclear matrix protein p84 [Melanopsichium pennsylvanicum 4]SNX87077.1 related to nuclear matrix protein p84 [Melanopsichium pennsylvanicum]
MSLSELAAERLCRCLSELIPGLLATLSDIRGAQPQKLLPFNQILDAVKPLVDSTNVKDAFGITPALANADKDGQEVRIRNLCLEITNNELRKVVLEDPSALKPGQDRDFDNKILRNKLTSTFDRLDAILALSLLELVDPTLPLSLVEELIESQPIATCSRLFEYTELRVKPLTIGLHPTRGKGLVLLRTCNELLKRLSKPSQQHTVFAGRILSLLAKVFPLGERSGVNLRGDFNVENKFYIEENTEDIENGVDESGDKDERDQIFKVDYEFYELFWKVQRFFSNPPLLMGAPESSKSFTRSATPADAGDVEHVNTDEDPALDGAKGPMAELRISTAKILKLFGAVTKREKELAGATSAEEAKLGGKKGESTISLMGPGGTSPSSNKRASGRENAGPFTGFLVGQSIGETNDEVSRKRSRPDIVDGVKTTNDVGVVDEDEPGSGEVALANGGHFFPTYLTGRKLFEYEIRDTSFRKHILVQYLVLFQYLLSFTPAAKESWKDWKNKTLQALFTLSDAEERWIRSTWREIQALIREIQPDGRLFLDSVLEVLKREANWIRWKTESCPSIEKPPLTPDQISRFASARALLLRKPEPYPHKLGTAALSELWQDGLKPPVPGNRRVENEEGEYVTVTTDGLEELEFLPPTPSLEHYHKSIMREKMKLDLRKKQLGIDAATEEQKLSKEQREKLDNDEGIQATVETMQSLAWRALRVASRDNLHLFGKVDRPENIGGLLKAMDEERNPKPKAGAQSEETPVDGCAVNNGESQKEAQESNERQMVGLSATESAVTIDAKATAVQAPAKPAE